MKYCNILSTFIYFSSKLEALPPNEIQALLPFSKSTSKKMSVPLAWSLTVPLPLFNCRKYQWSLRQEGKSDTQITAAVN